MLEFSSPDYMIDDKLSRFRWIPHTTLRRIRLLGNVAYALIVVATKKGEHPKAFGPKFHVERGCETFGLASETELPEGR